MNPKYIECACYSREHTLRVSFDPLNEDTPAFYVETHLTKLRFWKRVSYAVSYIFGKQSKYGAFEETVLYKKEVEELRDLCNEFLQG